MTEREQFEAAMCQLAEQPESSFEKPYDNDDVNAHWAVWQASRRAALEEVLAAIGHEHLCNPTDSVDDIAYEQAIIDCADAIRALSQKESGE